MGIGSAKLLTLISAVIITIAAMIAWRLSSLGSTSSLVKTDEFLEETFVDRAGTEHTFLVFLPPKCTTGASPPLLLFLNGLGENGFDGYWTIENNFGLPIWESKRSFPFICAIPQCAKGEDFSGEQLEIALDFADFVAEKYGTDPDRFYVTGVSQGGDGVWNAIDKYPDRFAAAVPLCGKPRVDVKHIAESGLPIWDFYNQGDGEELVELNHETRQGLIEAGASPLFTQYKQGGHDCWNLAYRSIGMWNWLAKQQRSPDRADSLPFVLMTPVQVLDSWRASPESIWSVSEEGSLSARRNEGEIGIAGSLVSDQAYRDFEFHVDAVFDGTATVCRVALVDSEFEKASSLEAVLPLPDSGVGGVRTQSGDWIALLRPEAQRQLQTEYANDIRIACHTGTLELRINGWLAVEVALPDPGIDGGAEFRPAIVADSGVAWKNLRVRAAKEQE